MTKPTLAKIASGIRGLDAIMTGGLPAQRATLICGGTGCGKTLMGMEFLVRGAVDYNEPGVFIAFEETVESLTQNVASLGFDLESLKASKHIVIDYVSTDYISPDITGDFNLDGLFIRLGRAIQSIQAKRVVLDTTELLFGSLADSYIVRNEFRRLLRWLSDQGVSSIVTCERGKDSLTRYGLEEYVSDCVVSLDHRITNQISTRVLRIIKYRGSLHGTNEYPFLIDQDGINILPLTSAGLDHDISEERISSGVETLDKMLGDGGFYRGSSVLISGTAGCGKTSIAAHFTRSVCDRNERCLYFLFEESPKQFLRNMRSIGVDLQSYIDNGRLKFSAARPSLYGLEMHLVTMINEITHFKPDVVIVDPISSFGAIGQDIEIKSMLVRLIDFLKNDGITTLMTDLTHGGTTLEQTSQEVSSLIDTWLLLRDIESSGERNRGIYILKSRGMAHSNQIREFTLSDNGVILSNAYIGPAGVLTGSARITQEAREQAQKIASQQEIERKKLALERKREALQSKIKALEAEFAADEMDALRLIHQEQEREKALENDRQILKNRRESE